MNQPGRARVMTVPGPACYRRASVSPRGVGVLPVRAAIGCSPRAAINITGPDRAFEKDVNFGRANPESPLESTKVLKNERKIGAKQTPKASRKYAKEWKKGEKETQKGTVPAPLFTALTRAWPRRNAILTEMYKFTTMIASGQAVAENVGTTQRLGAAARK